MKKTEVYSWRISPATKSAIEDGARRENTSVSALLERITKEWMLSRRGRSGDEAEQARLHDAVRKTVGVISGTDARRAEHVREGVRKRLKRRHGR